MCQHLRYNNKIIEKCHTAAGNLELVTVLNIFQKTASPVDSHWVTSDIIKLDNDGKAMILKVRADF
jgi:hypothetical protein